MPTDDTTPAGDAAPLTVVICGGGPTGVVRVGAVTGPALGCVVPALRRAWLVVVLEQVPHRVEAIARPRDHVEQHRVGDGEA